MPRNAPTAMVRFLRLQGWAVLFAVAWGVAADGAEIYRSDIHDDDAPKAGDGPAAIELVGARNGVFSGKIVVNDAAPVAELQVKAGDLRQGDAVIPASATRIRYGVKLDPKEPRHRSELLADAPPAGEKRIPVWATVRVPKDAKPGKYVGALSVSAKGLAATSVPMSVEVVDWALPDTKDWRTWLELLQSPDTLAMEYEVPMWSDRHWELIDRSLELIGGAGSRVAYIPLICHSNQGNADSMVRWVKQADGAYDFDYQVMDRYLDLAVKRMGQPKLVIFPVWEVFLRPPETEPEIKAESAKYAQQQQEYARKRWELRDQGPPVTMLDPATGKTETGNVPHYTAPEGKLVWQKLFAALRERMRRRGLEGAMMIGTSTDLQPSREQVVALHEITGGLPWASLTHHAGWLKRGEASTGRKALYGVADIGYTAAALGYMYVMNPERDRSHAWKRNLIDAHVLYWRFGWFNHQTLPNIRFEPAANITGNQAGIGHLGGDFWPALKDKRGRRTGNLAAPTVHPQSHWRSLNIEAWMIGPGADGPIPTARLMVLVEGMQECEARIVIEDALTDPARKAKLGPLADQAQKVVDQRHRTIWQARGGKEDQFGKFGLMKQYREIYTMIDKWPAKDGTAWFIGSGWAKGAGELFATAGQVQEKSK